MGEVASRWALLASIALHGVVLALVFSRPLSAVAAEPVRADFWGGTTLEVPQTAELGQQDLAESPAETKSEINTEGLDPSSGAQANPSTTATTTSTTTTNANPTTVRHAPGLAHSANSAALGGATSEGGSTGSPGPFGAEGSAPGVRDLLRSFVRAIPIVASSDPVWATLPLGAAGAVDVTLVLDEEGRPHTKAPFEPSVPSHLARLVSK